MLSCECSCGFHSLLNTIFWPFAKLMKQKMRAPGRNRANQPESGQARQAGAGPSQRLVLTQNWHLNCWLLREIMCSCGCGLIQSECLSNSNPPSECRALRDNESRALAAVCTGLASHQLSIKWDLTGRGLPGAHWSWPRQIFCLLLPTSPKWS